jgi:hypothetical protein
MSGRFENYIRDNRGFAAAPRSQCLFTMLTRTPAHFPEFNFEPRGFLEDRDELGLAGGRRMAQSRQAEKRNRCRYWG